jgi:hypothetical protein
MGMNVLYFVLGIVLIGLSSWGISVQKTNAATAGECEWAAVRRARG